MEFSRVCFCEEEKFAAFDILMCEGIIREKAVAIRNKIMKLSKANLISRTGRVVSLSYELWVMGYGLWVLGFGL